MSQAYSGVQGNVMAGAIDVDTSGWNLKHTVNTFDSTTTADAGWDDTTASTQRIEGDFTFFYNKLKSPYAVLMVAPGATPILKLYINKTDGNFFTGLGQIVGVSYGVKTKEGFVVTANFTNKGPWTMPTT
jgi:hypothetical protein